MRVHRGNPCGIAPARSRQRLGTFSVELVDIAVKDHLTCDVTSELGLLESHPLTLGRSVR